MYLISIVALLLLFYFAWTYVQNKFSHLFDGVPFLQKRKSNILRAKILLLLRGNEDALQRMYKREAALYPDLKEWEILQRIMDKLENDR